MYGELLEGRRPTDTGNGELLGALCAEWEVLVQEWEEEEEADESEEAGRSEGVGGRGE
jgi:hypothetical protein